MRLYEQVVEQYADFATFAHGESPCFEEWALGVTTDEELLGLVGSLPPVKQQPNLVFAAARWEGVPAPAPYAVFRHEVLARWQPIRATVLARSTQTNEVGRLATLVPVLAQLQARTGRPLALLELGASAGLCLVPDRVGYRWRTGGGEVHLPPADDTAPTLECRVTGPVRLPERLPDVGWRAGIDLDPVDVRDEDRTRWLETLVWPEQHERRSRLTRVLSVARRDPPRLVRGDLLTGLLPLLAEVPADLTPVVFHSAVVAYLDPPDRQRFSALMTGLLEEEACCWVSNEGPEVLPALTATGPPVAHGLGTFVLAVDGRARAWTHQHGSSMTWFGQ